MSGYAPYAALVAPARAKSELLRLLLGFALIEALYAGALASIDRATDHLPDGAADAYFGGTTALGLILQLASFGFLVAAVVLVLRFGHDRGLGSLIGAARPFWRDLWRAGAGVLALMLAMEAMPPWWDASLIDHMRPVWLWLALLAPALAVLLIQTGAEELLYRGYLQSQIAAIFPHPAVWMILPNIAFAAVHWNNGGDPVQSAQYVVWAFLFGLAASDLTARTGTLGAAIGFHLANNAFAFLFFAEVDGQDSGLALVLFREGSLSGSLSGDMPTELPPFLTLPFLVELAGVGLIWMAARLAIRR
jgi:membrane protease YdiL (CAAX protease family)